MDHYRGSRKGEEKRVKKEEVAMKKKVIWWVEILFVILVSCAVITVNVYFPEKDVRKPIRPWRKN